MTQIDEARERLTARAVAKLQGASTFYACHDYPELAEECAEIAQQLRAAAPRKWPTRSMLVPQSFARADMRTFDTPDPLQPKERKAP